MASEYRRKTNTVIRIINTTGKRNLHVHKWVSLNARPTTVTAAVEIQRRLIVRQSTVCDDNGINYITKTDT